MEEKQNSNSAPIDMEKFRNLTKNEITLQEELLDLFFMNVSEYLELMEITSNDNIWQDASIELERLSNSIGATDLSKLCAQAKGVSADSSEVKKKIIQSIRSNVQNLRVFIRNARY